MLVKDMYNKLAIITGFPLYTNSTDKPDTDRFLLHCLNEGLHNIIDCIYTNNNVLERTDTITTTPYEDKYGIEGIIKRVQLKTDKGYITIPHNDHVDPSRELTPLETVENEETGEITIIENSDYGIPRSFVISNGYLRLLPCPNKEMEVKVTLSTSHLVLSNNDIDRATIEDIDDTVKADTDFCSLVIMRAAILVFARARSQNAQIYSEICNKRLQQYIEQDYKTTQAQRFNDRSAGHYRSDRGLLDG